MSETGPFNATCICFFIFIYLLKKVEKERFQLLAVIFLWLNSLRYSGQADSSRS